MNNLRNLLDLRDVKRAVSNAKSYPWGVLWSKKSRLSSAKTGSPFKSNNAYSNNALSTSPLNSIVFTVPESVISPIT